MELPKDVEYIVVNHQGVIFVYMDGSQVNHPFKPYP